MKKINHVIEFLSLIFFNLFILLLPLKIALWVGRKLGDFAFNVLKIRRDVVIKNLSLAFPDKNNSEIMEIARQTYRNFSMSMMELISLPKIGAKDFDKHVEFEGLEYLDEILQQKQGAILIAGHFGSWELMGSAVCNKGYPLDFLVGRQHNSLVNSLLNFYRTQKKIGIIKLKMALKGVIKAIRSGRFIAMLSDQDAGKRDGVFVSFFGKPASTPKGPAVFALHTDAPVLMGFCIRQKSYINQKVKFVRVDFKKTGDHEKDIELLTQKYTQILEGFIKKYPDHWFWFHKRWKTTVDNAANMY